MTLIEIFLPRYYPDGQMVEMERFRKLQQELTQRFGGVTAFIRSAASGLWKDGHGNVERDEIAVFEVMVDELDRSWWKSFRHRLETEFDQHEILIRATNVESL